jgi:hypothetical protein
MRAPRRRCSLWRRDDTRFPNKATRDEGAPVMSAHRRFPFGHDPAPPREIIVPPAPTTEPLAAVGTGRTTDPLPAPLDGLDFGRSTEPPMAARRDTLPFRPAAPRPVRDIEDRSPPRSFGVRTRRALIVGGCVAVAAAVSAVTLMRRSPPQRPVEPVPSIALPVAPSGPLPSSSASSAPAPAAPSASAASAPPVGASSSRKATAPKPPKVAGDVVDPWAR